MSKRIVIIGASAAGVAAAMALRDHGFDDEVVLIGAETHLPYERPAISKELLLVGKAPLIVPETMYAEQRIELRLGATVTRLDVQRGQIELGNGSELRAHKVLLATGGRVRKLAVPGGELRNIHYVRSANDAAAIRASMDTASRVAVIGGGLIGAEVAASAIQEGCEVDWIEAGYRCLTRALPSPMDDAFMAIHRAKGVRIHVNASVTRILGTGAVQGVELADGRRIDADMIVVGIGIEPAMELAEQAGIQVGNGIIVDAFGATSAPGIYAAGDVACHQTRFMSSPGRLEHWKHAQQHGAAAARSMLGIGQAYEELPWFWTDQYEHHVEGCGLPHPGDTAVVRGDLNAGNATVFYLRAGQLVAAATLNRPNDVRAATRLISRGLTPSIEDLRDPQRDLRKVEKELAHASA